ncbi:EscU/YscU/HrcU family type III secretion system export apparatus switch protein [Desulfuromonas sp. KJ2020]|uniref:EscU/YscU/HrcU family type III secretion system export apparatus switch protein n=1 Tax=Desulfuromonas sp. KJ2020 TaxID=2919173 RepID=UPI000324EAD0|nr:EscU/YscU/HrcU family type III secretion system export apparatus switch protein [Desulfuromonas sp. KJ2020]MCP3178449.1 EscU/YscU/HrcU family type III secretion system export apparatus switch protein [Desulfuromonas sp. KJ2020]
MSEDKPLKKAVALQYDREKAAAPRVVASGRGEIAERILQTAREAGLPVREDADLLEVLARIPVGEEIPEDLYQVVAEILAFVYRVNGRYKEKAGT